MSESLPDVILLPGEHRPDNLRGLLTWGQPFPQPAVQRKADSEHYHDLTLGNRDRAATELERRLLEALGYTLPETLTCRIRLRAGGIRQRTFLELGGRE